MKSKKIMVLFSCATLLIACFAMPMTASASSYDRALAVENAREWVDGYTGIDWYTMDSDCTNFVSTCEAYAGVVSVVPNTIPVTSNIFRDWCLDESTDTWYMVKMNNDRLIGPDICWTYSSSWAFVSDFREYFSGSEYANSNAIASVSQYSISNATNISTLCSKLKAGDVIQYGNSGHSAIITKTGTSKSSVKYCGHSDPRSDEPLSTFISGCQARGSNSVYVIHFS